MLRPHELRYFYSEFPVWRDVALHHEIGRRAFTILGNENARSFLYRVTEVIGRIRNAGIDGLLRRIRANGKLVASNGHVERVS